MEKTKFTSYEIFLVAILSILQFSIVLDFMVIAPLGAMLMRELSINSSQFGAVVSAYAISAGLSGFLTAGFADKYDRKKLLLFLYGGFIIGTLFCALAPDYEYLFAARIVAGIFGGVMSSITFAIITDIFPFERRGRVMGFVQMAFAASQVLGIPAGLFLANNYGWNSPFFLIAGISSMIFVVVLKFLRPINEHLKHKTEKNAFVHFKTILLNRNYQRVFLTTIVLAGGFLLAPFSSAFLVNNAGVLETQLPIVFMITGICTIVTGPTIGFISDKFGKYKTFLSATLLSIVMIYIYTHMFHYPLYLIIIINSIVFMSVSSRMIGASSIITGVPEPLDRGGFMSVNSSIQQLSGGIAAMTGGLILVENNEGSFRNFDILGYIAIGSMTLSIVLMYFINRYVMGKQARQKG